MVTTPLYFHPFSNSCSPSVPLPFPAPRAFTHVHSHTHTHAHTHTPALLTLRVWLVVSYPLMGLMLIILLPDTYDQQDIGSVVAVDSVHVCKNCFELITLSAIYASFRICCAPSTSLPLSSLPSPLLVHITLAPSEDVVHASTDTALLGLIFHCLLFSSLCLCFVSFVTACAVAQVLDPSSACSQRDAAFAVRLHSHVGGVDVQLGHVLHDGARGHDSSACGQGQDPLRLSLTRSLLGIYTFSVLFLASLCIPPSHAVPVFFFA